MKSLKFIYPLLLVVVLLGWNCNDSFEDINTNENNPEKVTVNVLLTSAQNDVFEKLGGFDDGFMGTFTQHFAGNHATGIDLDQYNLNNGHFADFFDDIYLGSLKDFDVIITQGTEEGNMTYVGVAKILTAWALGFLTDIYGDLPWSQALKPDEFPTPTYDTQEQLYADIQRLLTEGISDLDGSSVLAMGADDLVYGGDASKWKAAAHLLKARHHNHLSKRDAAGSATAALSSIDAAKAAGFTSSANDLHMPFEGTADHRNPWYTMWENNQVIAGRDFINELKNNNDPRLEAYFDNFAFGDPQPNVGYEGKQNGFGVSPMSFSPVGPDGYYGQLASPVLVATYFELLFIEAEAAMRANQPDRAATAHNAAVEAQIMKVVDMSVDSISSRVQPYLDAFASEDAGSITMEKIMTEKYKAMFTMETECWTDLRRHNFAFPSTLILPTDQNGTVYATEHIRRILYPQSELNNNFANVPSGVGIFDKLWWDQ